MSSLSLFYINLSFIDFHRSLYLPYQKCSPILLFSILCDLYSIYIEDKYMLSIIIFIFILNSFSFILLKLILQLYYKYVLQTM